MSDDYRQEDASWNQNVPMNPVYTTSSKKGEGNGYGMAAFILGVASFFLFICCINYITAILAIIFAILQMVKNRKKALAVSAIVLACLSILMGTLFWVGIYGNSEYLNMDDLSGFYEEQI